MRRIQIVTAACAALMWTAAAGAQAPAGGSAQGSTQAGSSTGATAAPTPEITTQDEQTSTDPTGTRSSNNDLQQFVQKATIGNMAEIQLSELALKQAENPQVMQFARMMVDEHTRALEQLRALAGSQGLQVAGELDGKHQKLHQKLSELQGAEFDRAYMDAMVDAHKDSEKLLKRRAGKDASASAASQGVSGATGTSGASGNESGTSAIGTSGSSDTSAPAGASDSTSGSTETDTPSVGTPAATGTSGASSGMDSAGSTTAPASADEWASMMLPTVRAHLEKARTLEEQVKQSGRSNSNNNNNDTSGAAGSSTPPKQ